MVPLDFLLTASKKSLEDAMLNRFSESSNRRKQILELLDSWAERRAESLLLTWFLNHGNELMATITLPPRVTEVIPLLRARAGPLSAEEFRDSLRSLVES
jgi:hypothetical protein